MMAVSKAGEKDKEPVVAKDRRMVAVTDGDKAFL